MKMLLKRLLALLLLAAMLTGLAACAPVLSPADRPTQPTGQESRPQTGAETDAPGEAVRTEGPKETPAPVYLPLSINELMPSNKATIADDSGLFPDWVELYNYGGETLSLEGLVLRCGSKTWALPAVELRADDYLLIFCDGSGSDARHASITLPKEGADLRLETAEGALIEEFCYPACGADLSLSRDGEGAAVVSAFATPGYENSLEGYKRLQSVRGCDSPLQISEVMVYNQWYLGQRGVYYDWVELKNVSADEISLHDYYLSDSGSNRAKYRLPDRTLAPGEYAVVFCTGDETVNSGFYAPFGLSAERDQLFLSRADGTLADYAAIHDVPYHGSFGRLDGQNGFFFFDRPTPGAANAGGARSIADKPRLLGRDGVFNGVSEVTVELSSSGEIRYTTNGAEPTAESELYEGPLSLTKTTVIRAISIEDGKLTSAPAQFSFIINEGHTLPVVSLTAEPGYLFGGAGLYSNPSQDIERPGSVQFFENGQGFTIECGIKLHGATSKLAQEKKSFKLCFRSRYEGELHYDLFENGVTDFSSILLRAAQESTYSTLMRDNIVHQLAIAAFPELPAQDYKYAVLYVNGRYWGVYNIREAHSDEHYAYHYGYDPDTVTQWKEIWDKTGEVGELCRFALNHDLSNDENYNYVAEHINVDSVIGWTILQAWCSNHDCNPPNMRFYYSTEDKVLRYALVDLDLGMFEYDLFDVPLYGSIVDGTRYAYAFNNLARKLMENKQYQLRMAEQLAAALKGPMSDENVLALIDDLADQIRPEIQRDRDRWAKGGEGDSAEFWEHGFQMVDFLRTYVTRKDGRAMQLLKSFLSHSNLTEEEKQQYFGDLLN